MPTNQFRLLRPVWAIGCCDPDHDKGYVPRDTMVRNVREERNESGAWQSVFDALLEGEWRSQISYVKLVLT